MCGPNYVGPTGVEGCAGNCRCEKCIKYYPESLKSAREFLQDFYHIPSKSVQRREELMRGISDYEVICDKEIDNVEKE